MSDVASLESGARLAQASSYHCDYPPQNILDRSETRPWVTSGLFPQYFVVSFPDLINIQSVDIRCYNVKSISLEKCASSRPNNYEEVTEKTLEEKSGMQQTETLLMSSVSAQHLRFTIHSGYDHFCAVYGLTIIGGSPGQQTSVESPAVAKPMTSALGQRGSSLGTPHHAPKADLEEQGKTFNGAFRVPSSKKFITNGREVVGVDHGQMEGEIDDDDDDDDDEVEAFPMTGDMDEEDASAMWKEAAKFNQHDEQPVGGATVMVGQQGMYGGDSEEEDNDEPVLPF